MRQCAVGFADILFKTELPFSIHMLTDNINEFFVLKLSVSF